ncbi:hypothetical protein AOC36_11695 (plasmid) [Erysipelothrix larvae]|uniref:Uncharacterized protein n=1 Tax=Erysipelothrix larvae TaxID=1514105 RepID=A0A0X8H158_9FIRM|nr:hypothetical protein [Erysipelothrix larvae]AMC94180.1 hypothetical protein AOC36_09310 [Erysipelothrix larvae]AMC94693.1 hypothetical protein AOC36_11695 [Erysipelothrix larvae]
MNEYKIKLAFRGYELKKIKKCSEARITRLFLEGNYASPQAPHGYRKENKKLIVIEDPAEAVRRMVTLMMNTFSKVN